MVIDFTAGRDRSEDAAFQGIPKEISPRLSVPFQKNGMLDISLLWKGEEIPPGLMGIESFWPCGQEVKYQLEGINGGTIHLL